MQTFLPFPHFIKSLKTLDNKRLGKQRVECLQMLNDQWANHPACVMWRGYHDALHSYAQTAVDIWVERGMNNSLHFSPRLVFTLPWWFGNPLVHRSHQLRLLEKDFRHYSVHFRSRQPDDPWGYVWPQESGCRIRKLPKFRPLPHKLAAQRQAVQDRFPNLASTNLHVLLDPYDQPKAYGYMIRFRRKQRSYWCLQSHTTGKEAKPVCYLTEDLA